MCARMLSLKELGMGQSRIKSSKATRFGAQALSTATAYTKDWNSHKMQS